MILCTLVLVDDGQGEPVIIIAGLGDHRDVKTISA